MSFGAGNYIKNILLNTKEFEYSLSTKSFPSIRFSNIFIIEKKNISKKNIANNSGNYLASRLLFSTKQNHTNANTGSPPNNIL